MTLLERNREIERRLNNIESLRPKLEQIIKDGKREQLLAGRDREGVPFAPLAMSTLRRSLSGIPLVPRLAGSSLISCYVVTVTASSGAIEVSAGWPGLDWVQYHRDGTRHMPRRDPTGFREQDKASVQTALREYLFNG